MTKQQALQLLGLTDLNSTDKDIKKAFRSMAKKYHPDVVGEAGREKFMMIQEAYNSLCDNTFSAPPISVTHSSIFKVVKVV